MQDNRNEQAYIGVDIIEIDRIDKAIRRWQQRFLGRIYTCTELGICRNKVQALAARFAAKEAVMKALGTGARGVGWRDIEILSDVRGKPLIKLTGRARERAKVLKMPFMEVSMSHCRNYAVAVVITRGVKNEDSHLI